MPAKKLTGSAGAKMASVAADKLVLDNAIFGQVVLRFPPEASGYLHIGHAKAALANHMLAKKYEGRLIFRFDDTNPEKEKESFETQIIEDLKWLEVEYNTGPTFSSDYFETMLVFATKFVDQGLAYCDTSSIEDMRTARMKGEATPSRDNTVAENQRLWKEMQVGSEEGQRTCLRAKISVNDANKALRDPTIYRVKLLSHPHTGDRYKVYPTYDWCCPIMDSVEGVTHALRTSEYNDRNAQYKWICKALNIREPHVEDFSRLNMEHTVMSKRKLRVLVEEGIVSGWDDPRMPTVRGLARHGLCVEALREFIRIQGMSKAINLMEWSKLWRLNQQFIDPVAERFTTVCESTAVKTTIVDGPVSPEMVEAPRHPRQPDLGTKSLERSSQILLDAADVSLLSEGEEITLLKWGNAIVQEIVRDALKPVAMKLQLHLEGEIKGTKYKLHWLSNTNPSSLVKVVTHEYDQLLVSRKPEEGADIHDAIAPQSHYTDALLGEPLLRAVVKGQKLQLERRGFYIVDEVSDTEITMILIPDARTKINHLSAKALVVNPTATTGNAKSAGAIALEQKRAAKQAARVAAKAKQTAKKQ